MAGIDYRSVDKKKSLDVYIVFSYPPDSSLVFVSSEIDAEIYGVPA